MWLVQIACDVCEKPQGDEPAEVLQGDRWRWVLDNLERFAEVAGWAKIDGRWHCRDCARIARAAIPAASREGDR